MDLHFSIFLSPGLGSKSALNECGSIALVKEKVESVKQVFFIT